MAQLAQTNVTMNNIQVQLNTLSLATKNQGTRESFTVVAVVEVILMGVFPAQPIPWATSKMHITRIKI